MKRETQQWVGKDQARTAQNIINEWIKTLNPKTAAAIQSYELADLNHRIAVELLKVPERLQMSKWICSHCGAINPHMAFKCHNCPNSTYGAGVSIIPIEAELESKK